MEDIYDRAYVEILEILKYISNEEYDKIPKDKIKFYEDNKDKNYKYEYDLNNLKTLRKTDAIIVNLYKNYIATSKEKEKVEEILRLNLKKSELNNIKKYDADNIFKNKI